MDIAHKTLKTTYKKVSIARWTIDDFFGHVNKQTDYLKSDSFVLDGLDTNFYLQVYLSNGTFNYLSYCLNVADMADEKPIKVKAKFWLENEKGEKCAETPFTTETFTQNGDWGGFFGFLKHLELHSKAAFFGNGPAVVCCEMTYQAVIDKPESPKIDKTLRESLWKSYEKGLFDGVTIQVKGKEFKVSKMILSANSVVFERMFLTPNCKEVQTGILELKDTNADVMEAFIKYIHRGEIEISETIAIDLFKLSHKYDVKPLIALCINSISKSVSADKLFDIVVLAYEYSCDHLKNAVFAFLLANCEKRYFTSLTKTRKWFNFAAENVELADDILTSIYGKMGVNF